MSCPQTLPGLWQLKTKIYVLSVHDKSDDRQQDEKTETYTNEAEIVR